jgi:hypothetical protein
MAKAASSVGPQPTQIQGLSASPAVPTLSSQFHVSILHLRRHALNARAKLIDGNGNADGAQLASIYRGLLLPIVSANPLAGTRPL